MAAHKVDGVKKPMNEPTLQVKTLLQLLVLQHLVFGWFESQVSVQEPTGDDDIVVSSFNYFIEMTKQKS